TDNDGDGLADFDGSEYDEFPAELFIDSFFEEKGPFGNQLVLLSTAGMSYQNEVNFLIWNNREQKFSRTIKFQCFLATNLKSISNVAGRLNGDPDEIGHNTQTGWVDIKGGRVLDLAGNQAVDAETGDDIVNAPLLGVFMQQITGQAFSVGNALHFTG